MNNSEYRRFGKAMADVLALKKHFFDDNERHLYRCEEVSKLYRESKRREKCKICSAKIPLEVYFTNHGTDYYLCQTCGHLNGAFDDDMVFSEKLYSSGLYYIGEYMPDNPALYNKRMDAIYTPKVQFMYDSLSMHHGGGGGVNQMRYLDIGCGTGFMTGAMDRIGLDARGIEVSKAQVEYGNRMLKKELCAAMSIQEITDAVKTTDRDVVVFINVLEHITNLIETLESVRENENIKYMYFCVPLLSLSCALEAIFPEIFPRHIGGGGDHTHLFTEESLGYIFNKYQFTKISTWTFGADIMDLYRSIMVKCTSQKMHLGMIERISRLFQEQGDAIQLIVDKAGFASDVHIVAKVH